MSQANTSMNFLPEDYVEKRQAARAAVVFIGLLLVVVGGVVGAYKYSLWNLNGPIAENDRVTAEFEDASKKIAEAQELEKQKEKMVAKAEITTTLMERVRRSALLNELTRLRPPGVNFVGMELKSKEVLNPQNVHSNSDLERAQRIAAGLPPDVTKPPLLDVTVTLTGSAPTDGDVAAYMAAMQKSPILTGVSLLFSEEYRKNKDDAPSRRFNVEMHINPDADLRGTAVVDAMPKN